MGARFWNIVASSPTTPAGAAEEPCAAPAFIAAMLAGVYGFQKWPPITSAISTL